MDAERDRPNHHEDGMKGKRDIWLVIPWVALAVMWGALLLAWYGII